GQTISGGTASGESLLYTSTTNATKGNHQWGTTLGMIFNEANGNLRIGRATDGGFKLDVNGTSRFSNSLRIDTNVLLQVDSTGTNFITSSGGVGDFSLQSGTSGFSINL